MGRQGQSRGPGNAGAFTLPWQERGVEEGGHTLRSFDVLNFCDAINENEGGGEDFPLVNGESEVVGSKEQLSVELGDEGRVTNRFVVLREDLMEILKGRGQKRGKREERQAGEKETQWQVAGAGFHGIFGSRWRE